MESTVEAVEGRLKSPSKKQGIICRTLLKALLMECFAWLPPGTFPSSSERLFKVSSPFFLYELSMAVKWTRVRVRGG